MRIKSRFLILVTEICPDIFGLLIVFKVNALLVLIIVEQNDSELILLRKCTGPCEIGQFLILDVLYSIDKALDLF